jgi:hypothetical protein
MTRMLRNVLAAAALVAATGPAFAQTNLILPPYNGDPTPKIATEGAALAALHQRGVVDVRRLGKVGDYWESDGRLNGGPIVAYVFDSGAIEIKPSAQGAIQSAALPPVDAPEQSAELPQ